MYLFPLFLIWCKLIQILFPPNQNLDEFPLAKADPAAHPLALGPHQFNTGTLTSSHSKDNTSIAIAEMRNDRAVVLCAEDYPAVGSHR